ncbi:PKD domain-containing protein [Candidatus Bipolaricaulota bacterium]
MHMPKARFLLLVGFLALICVAIILPGCARFDGIVDFTASPTSGKKPLSVQFTPVVEGSVRRHFWNFGDGQTSTERSPEHTYVDAGAYTVILMVEPRRGEPTSVLKEDYITVTASGFGSSPSQLIAQDDDFNLWEMPKGCAAEWGSWSTWCVDLDVLANDMAPNASAELTIVGIKEHPEDALAQELYIGTYEILITRGQSASERRKWISIIREKGFWSDTERVFFFYCVSDGQETAIGEVFVECNDPGAGDHFIPYSVPTRRTHCAPCTGSAD